MSGWRLAAMAVISLLLAGALNPCTSHAEFTQEEVTSILHAREGALNMAQALSYVASLMNNYTTASTRPIFGTVMQAGTMGSSEANAAITFLVNAIPFEPGTPTFSSFAGLPRAERVAHAWSRIDRTIMYAEHARHLLRAARRFRSQDRQYQDWVKRAGDLWVGAVRHLSAIDRGLAYASPHPAAFPQVVGPHGDFARAEQALFLSQAYAHNALGDLADAYLVTTLTTASGNVFMRLLDATNAVINSMVLLTGVTWNEQQASRSDFFRTLDVLQTLTDHARLPRMWAQAITELRPWKASSSLDVAVQQTDRITDAWMKSDDAAWRLMVFPDCSKLKNPQGCGGR